MWFKNFTSLKDSDFIYLSSLIRDKRVLVVGSGPSADEIESIPSDVVTFTTGLGGYILKDVMHPHIDLYYLEPLFGKSSTDEFCQSLQGVNVNVWLTLKPDDRVDYVRHVFYEGSKNTDFRRLHAYDKFDPTTVKRSDGFVYDKRMDDPSTWNSSGVTLLQLALMFEAREIYLAGIDLQINAQGEELASAGDRHYARVIQPYKDKRYKKRNRKQVINHREADLKMVQFISQRWSNVFAVSDLSPITEYFNSKRLA